MFERPEWWPAALAVALVGALLAWRGYVVPEGWGGRATLLRGLRAAVFAALAVALIGPGWRRPARATESGGVAVVIDASMSMAVADVQRPAAERLRIAAALGRWTDPDAASKAEAETKLARITTAVAAVGKARREVEVVELTRRDPVAPRARLTEARATLDRLRAEATQDAGLDAGVRGAIATLDDLDDAGSPAWLRRSGEATTAARESLRRADDARLDRLSVDDPRAAEAARAIAESSRLDLARAALGAPDGILNRLSPGTPVSFFSFDTAVRSATLEAIAPTAGGTDLSVAVANTIRLAKRRPAAVLLVSDGRSVSTTESASGAGGVPVFGLAVVPGAAPPGVRVARVEVPGSLSVGQSGRALVTVRSEGMSAPATVRFQSAGQTQVRQVELSPGEERTLDFDLRAERPGDLVLELGVDGVPGAAPSPAQRFRRVVRVTRERARVLFVSGAVTSWDAQAMRSALSATPWMRLAEARADAGLASRLSAADGVVLADVAPADLDTSARAALDELVSRRGGGVLLLPGPTRLPGEWFGEPDLARYLPAGSGAWRSSPSAAGSVVAVPTASGADLGPSAEWAVRPALFRAFVLGTLRPGATALLAERDTGMPLLTESPLGLGRSLMLATDQAWRWRVGPGAHPLWPALVSRLVEPPYAASDGAWSLDVSPSEGRSHLVRVRRVSTDGTPLRGAGAPTVIVRREGRTVAEIALDETAQGRWSGVLRALTDGEYTVQLRDAEQPRVTLLVGDGGLAELSDLSGDRAALDRLTRATGADTYDLPEIAALGTALAGASTPATDAQVTDRLWDSPVLAALILSLLTAEWALRKHWGAA